ncbi:PhzF family phenazine biosynthesis isomerase [Deinococcus arenicola]|uniref:PhzF family phenazine biosynthesis isomerase n=1 Tax=Deinococcus arenicola TaxID=2994950 RepID=A0ABU4DMP3_9DEIO|nr:PhzF family phenazine biosynthesis isomerase [Deinococcus sp. ZS9-10]MDV6373705.1 PhzF family phenazine biosynthesis isomerase [Deinococcus sp. ZS9-10]
MIAYSEVSAFTSTPGQGNRAGVVLDASALSEAEMRELAAFLGAPETVFVTRMALSRTGPSAVRVRYFTPTQEVDFCGHATLALGLLLAQGGHWRGEALELETLAGRVPLRLLSEAGVPHQVWMQQQRHEVRPLPTTLRTELAEALGIDSRMVHRGLPMAAASTGLWSAFVPLLDPTILDALDPDLERIAMLSAALDVGSVYAYAPMGVSRFAARDFAPLLGIPEDPVTGSAGGALMALLARAGHLPVRGGRACGVIYQGHAIGSPGEVEVEVEMRGVGDVMAVHVGGCAVLEREGIWKRGQG